MPKHLIKICSMVLLLICLGVAIYFYFRPKEAAVVVDDYIASSSQDLTYANIEDYVLADDQVHYLWLCDMNDNDCVYTRDYIIKPLTKELEVSQLNDIEFVDFYEAPESTHYMTNTWGFASYPAFVAVQNVDGTMTVLNYLSWNKDDPFDSQDLKTWMYENGIWQGVYEVEEKIAPAIE